MAVATNLRRCVAEFKRLRLVPEEIFGDECGLGIVMIGYLAEMGWRIRKFNNGDTARDEEHYCNVGSEIWFTMAKRINSITEVLLAPAGPMRTSVADRAIYR